MTPVYFDIETEALPVSELDEAGLIPKFEAPSNYKNADAIERSKSEQLSKWLENGALDPRSGRVIAIGVLTVDGQYILGTDEDEAVILTNFWRLYKQGAKSLTPFVGFNIFHFDLPFLIRRSLQHGLQVPFGFLPLCHWWEHGFTDLMQWWQCGNRQDRISLDSFAKFLGVGAKEMSGKHFAAMLREDREKAEAYNKNELELCKRIFGRLQLVTGAKPNGYEHKEAA